ncbi:MAG: RING finger and CHY zinc finger domain-containing protein 1, partial [Harvfovirus sp.]
YRGSLCEHYRANCSIVAGCCGKIYACKKCHNEMSDHNIRPEDISELVCQNCFMRQMISPQCCECNIIFGKYSCLKCKIFDNLREMGASYHCDKCNLCLCQEEGSSVEVYHCDKCNCCLNVQFRDNHKCKENRMQDNCCICLELLLEAPSRFIKCGHILHKDCLETLLKTSNKCPLCNAVFDENFFSL